MNLVWFRHDLRVEDNPALFYAARETNIPLTAIYINFAEQWRAHDIGINRQVLMHQAVRSLAESLAKLNITLLWVEAHSFDQAAGLLSEVCEKLAVEQLFFNVEVGWNERQRDKQVVELLQGRVTCKRFAGDHLVPPWEVVNQQQTGYKVFSAFARVVRQRLSQSIENCLPPMSKKPVQNRLTDLSSLNQSLRHRPIQYSIKFAIEAECSLQSSIVLPEVSEKKAAQQLQRFCSQQVEDYAAVRDFPAIEGTSQLSMAFSLGSISISRCYAAARTIAQEKASKWLDELIWRDFYRAVMWHFPHVSRGQAFDSVERSIRWSQNAQDFERFCQARTGVPIVDAAILQLLNTGWMHNRLRMVVASYFTKNLWLDWRQGESFFAQHLLDWDFASNNGGWQWCASVGTDAAPYFRVFNPKSQQERFDAEAAFIKTWLPQLSKLSAKQIHQFDKQQLPEYCSLQVDLGSSRKLAIEAFKQAKAESLS